MSYSIFTGVVEAVAEIENGSFNIVAVNVGGFFKPDESTVTYVNQEVENVLIKALRRYDIDLSRIEMTLDNRIKAQVMAPKNMLKTESDTLIIDASIVKQAQEYARDLAHFYGWDVKDDSSGDGRTMELQ